MNALEIAAKMETDAIAFYTECAGKSANPIGKKLFLTIAEDEKRHLEYLNTLLKGMPVPTTNIDPMNRIRTVFEENKDKMLEKISATASEIDAFKVAMTMEKEGYEFYLKHAVEATDPQIKALFERLKAEEDKHYKVFSNSFSFLTDTGNWYMWDERAIVEG